MSLGTRMVKFGACLDLAIISKPGNVVKIWRNAFLKIYKGGKICSDINILTWRIVCEETHVALNVFLNYFFIYLLQYYKEL